MWSANMGDELLNWGTYYWIGFQGRRYPWNSQYIRKNDVSKIIRYFFVIFHFIIFLAWSSIAQSVCQRAFSLLANWCLGSRVQILLSAEGHNWSPFDLNIACLCQSIEINNNKHVYRQSQVRKSTDSGAKWAECSLIIGTGCRVQVFSLILDSSVGLSASIQSAGELVSGVPGSNPAFSRGTQLVSFRFEYRLPVPEHWN